MPEEATEATEAIDEGIVYTAPSGVDVKKRRTKDGAIEHTLVDKELYHREDGPAIVYKNTWSEWRVNGALHRDEGLPAVTRPEGDREWWINGIRHRDDGPAQVVNAEPTEEEKKEGKAEGKVVLQRFFIDGRQHREDGPANIFWNEDKKELEEDYWLEGVQVPEAVVMTPDKLVAKEVMTEDNAEIRRIMIERMGPGKFLDDVGAKIIDVDNHHQNGMRSLMRAGAGDGEDEVAFLVCACPSTGRVYYMQVPPDSETCEAADTWLSGELPGAQVGRT